MKSSAVLLSSLLLSVACAPVITRPMMAAATVPSVTVETSVDRSWDAAVAWFTERSLPIKDTDRCSGLIMTEPEGIPFDNYVRPPWDGQVAPRREVVYANCGARSGVPLDPTKTAYNVRVTGDAKQSVVATNVRYTESGEGVGNSFFVCLSTGKWEREIQTYIKSKAEAQ